ncbi:MAG: gamma-glutamyl-gamma-aminobutyrate hydrolase family protein [Clostridium sp.]|uniref:gamma-glutamyl-gamma-aminobutyrate hydrolase family protein n=1 Tax=Clostridium sp. TaxID=1506 RepID=UPI003F3133F1
MDRRPIIGISASLTIDNNSKMLGRRLVSLSENYVNAVLASGGIPFVLPINNNLEIIKDYATIIDGLILSGGHDINPLCYNEEPSLQLGMVLPERDLFDISLVQEVERLNKPILGICRGNQILNICHGGSLYQDLSLTNSSFIKHNQDAPEYEGTHTVFIESHSNLRNIIGESILVNSYHHQCIDKLGSGFKVSALSRDGVIESIESISGSFKLGIQWHPEMMASRNTLMKNLFDYFISKCK